MYSIEYDYTPIKTPHTRYLLLSLTMRGCFSDGLFAAYMQVSIQNDGPVTITLESPSSSGGTDSVSVDPEAS